MAARSEVAITGAGVVSPFGRGLDALAAGLSSGRDALAPLARFLTTLEAPPIVGEVRSLPDEDGAVGAGWSRTDRLAVAAAREAWSSSGLGDASLDHCAVFMATTVGGLSDIQVAAAADPNGYCRTGGLASFATYPVSHPADAVADALGAGGFSMGVSVACASGAVAIAHAARRILRREVPVALAGGTDALCPFTLAGFQALQALDAERCRPFDRSRRGLNLGEGAAVLVLEDLENARRRGATILAVLRGWALTNDASHPTAPDEEGRGLASSMRGALEMAGAGVEEIGYVNAHGTGTPLNDVAEARAYESVFGGASRRVPVSSTKSYIGHTLGAAGAIEAVITLLALRTHRLFPTLRLVDAIEAPSVDWLMDGGRETDMTAALSVSAGFGGNNAALLLASEHEGHRA
jgi:3-oxoacyl-[acyl-carrier-protein] synthase II